MAVPCSGHKGRSSISDLASLRRQFSFNLVPGFETWLRWPVILLKANR
jgi:hypothetical protein